MLRPLSLIALLLILVSCGEKKSTSNAGVSRDTLIAAPAKLPYDSSWYDVADYFAVYSLDSNTCGIAFERVDGSHYPFIDSLFEGSVDLSGASEKWPNDTGSQFTLHEDPVLTSNFPLSGKQLYVVGTRGQEPARLKGVRFTWDECRSNLVVLLLDRPDPEKTGVPLVCSKEPLALTYGRTPELAASVTRLEERQKALSDYSDSTRDVVFAWNDSLVFVHHDDFRWHRHSAAPGRCLFPGRQVLRREKDSLRYVWGQALDLFGIPCD